MWSTKSLKLLAFSFLFILISFTHRAFGAACCGGGFAIPSVITGDDLAQLTTTYSYSKIDTYVDENALWKKSGSNDSTQTLKIEGSHIFYDRYQAGFSLPVQTREKSGAQGGQSTGLGDISATGGYEYLPDWEYSLWRPHGVGFATITLPTGKSVYEMDDNLAGLDSQGRGFAALGMGSVLTKTWLRWDANASLEVHHSFAKSIHSAQVNGTATPGNGGNISIGSGYNWQNLRIGAAINWSYEDAIRVDGSISSQGTLQRFAAGILNASYMLPENWAATLSYSDQLLFGSPLNTPLSRSVALLLQKRWAR